MFSLEIYISRGPNTLQEHVIFDLLSYKEMKYDFWKKGLCRIL